ncbi:MAG: signal peptide peptidase SppA [Chitinophagaceae bacterium]|nr:MAG: signal peptide peptidase SppA [Chitinophagaceae bacterium]
MRAFLKMFLASFLALVLFCVVGLFFFIAAIAALGASDKPRIAERSVLRIDLSQHFAEQERRNPLSRISGGEADAPGLYDVLRLVRKAADDKNIAGIYLQADDNGNGYAASEELRSELAAFKKKGKFVIAFGNRMSQKAYYLATVADKIYVSPQGFLEWKGLAVELMFFKNALDRLRIQPQVFYAGKFKSATEPFRAEQMTPANRLQTQEFLDDIDRVLLYRVGQSRGIDTATLYRMANEGSVQNAEDALRYKLVDGLRYDDQVRDELKQRIGAGSQDKLAFTELSTYGDAVSYKASGDKRIALIYAEGTIMDGPGDRESIGDEEYIKWIRKARLDKSVKAIVLRINSGGGSALASENIWRELKLAKEAKPLVVSFGDVAASGGYYIATAADSIFALPNTITGSIGVFSMIPNLQGFFNEKLGVTFDGVKTATYADRNNVFRALSPAEAAFQQREVDRIYSVFKQRVADGRKKDTAYIGSIAQGRVWSGEKALQIGLIDRLGGLEEAVRCAARMAKTDSYRLREYPERGGFLEDLLDRKKEEPMAQLRKQLGAGQFAVFEQLVELNRLCGAPQARMPFAMEIR